MYDSREKAVRDLESGLIDARDEGLAKGREEGEIKIIRMLQEIVGDTILDESELKTRSLDQLQSLSADLRNRILRRQRSKRRLLI